ncbi:MAG: hypothetical protein L6V93_14205 [Clostridiales bacterium]|nr:MAG: hypothetical protein L6V93_14205 [Clostridiales bacterium]
MKNSRAQRAASYFVNEIRKPLVLDYLDLCMDFTDKIFEIRARVSF